MKEFFPQAWRNQLARIDKQQIEQWGFGVIALDTAARVVLFNSAEERLSGLPRAEVIGKDFFVDVAPCTASRLFRGRYLRAREEGQLDEHFFYTFTYRIRPISAHVHMLHDSKQTALVFLFLDRAVPLFEDLG
ncbi:PAS domain-containing protein [Acidithiobacillus sp. IBUN Pt1247-S3]|uniref:PAS domain-containing protein n=1 Tax=Acidithiobacillus sp. IBUN Pt1247-S3 TaxID=3166642 RepID=UPI0034E48D2C